MTADGFEVSGQCAYILHQITLSKSLMNDDHDFDHDCDDDV